MEMGIVNLSMSMSAAKIGNEISMRVMKIALEQMEQTGEMINSLTASVGSGIAADASVGQMLDMSV